MATKFRFTPDHVLYGKLRPYLNKVALPTFDGVCTTEILPILPDPDRLDKWYLWGILLHPEFVRWASNIVTGANLPRLSPGDLTLYRIPLPLLVEQRRIAAILRSADDERRRRRYTQSLSDGLLGEVFVRMFANGPCDALQGTQHQLKDLAVQITDGEHATPDRVATGIKLLSARNIQNGYLDFEAELDYITPAVYTKLSKRCAPAIGDILMSCSGTIGRVATVATSKPLALVRSVALIKPNRALIASRYLEFYLRSDCGQSVIARGVNQSSQGNIFLNQIEALPILVPPMELQLQFVAIVAKHDCVLRQQHESARQSDHLFDTLLHQAFAGEL